MHISILAPLPHLFSSFFETAIVRRAIEAKIISLTVYDLHKWGKGNYKQIDDTPYGGGGGMVIRPDVLYNALSELKQNYSFDEIIYPTPDGEQLNMVLLKELTKKNSILIICGHYKGLDYRFRELFITKEISIGDYVISSGELAAAVIVDAFIRLIPGVVNSFSSVESDSFYNYLLEPPVYTKPQVFMGLKVPPVLLSGNHKLIKEWRLQQAIERTKNKRPDLYQKFLENLSKPE